MLDDIQKTIISDVSEMRSILEQSKMLASGTDDLTLLNKWAPEFHLHPDETFLPCSIEWYLQRCSLTDQNGNVVYTPIINGTSRKDSSVLADKSLGQRRLWHINILNPASQVADLSSARCYAYKRPVLDASNTVVAYDLNYWMFYAYNGNIFNQAVLGAYIGAMQVVAALTYFIPGVGPLVTAMLLGGTTAVQVTAQILSAPGLGLHEGDWEYAVVRVPPDGSSIQQIYLSAHAGEGGWTTDFDRNAAGQPIVYVAINSHANYTTAGTHVRLGGVANDVTAEGGTAWPASGNIVDVGFDVNSMAALQWVGPGPARYDSGDDPAIAINGNDLVLAVRKNDGKLYYMGGVLSEDGALAWWTQSGVQFDTGHNDPCVALNDDGFVVSLHRSSNTNLYWNAGVIDPDNKVVAWWNDGHGTKYDVGGGDPAVALNDAGVVLSVHQGQHGGLYLNAGVVDGHAETLNWANNGSGTKIWTSGSNPAIALNNRNEVVVCYADSGDIRFSVGVYDPSNQTVTWNTTAVPIDTGGYPAVALNDDGEVVMVFRSDGTLYYNVGEIYDLDSGAKTIKWASPTGIKYGTSQNGQAVALTDDGNVVEAHRSGADLYAQTATLLIDGFDNWIPRNGQDWLKYSGRWGKPGSPPLIEIGDTAIAVEEDGPTGPAYKGSYLGGPQEN
jgi:hypothetical protein